MNINIYNSKNVKAQFDGMEYSRFLLQVNPGITMEVLLCSHPRICTQLI
jgi:hypothetical protein